MTKIYVKYMGLVITVVFSFAFFFLKALVE